MKRAVCVLLRLTPTTGQPELRPPYSLAPPRASCDAPRVLERILRVADLHDADELDRDTWANSTPLERLAAVESIRRATLALYASSCASEEIKWAALVHLQHRLGKKPSRTPEEEEFIVAMQQTWEKARTEGELARGVRDVLAVLRVRGIVVPEAVRKRIQAEKDPAQLERWHERAILAVSAAEVIDEPSRAA